MHSSRFGLLEPPGEAGPRSNGIDLLRGAFALYVLLLSHIVFWTDVVQGADAVPLWLARLSHLLVWLFQSRGELNPAVLGFVVLSGFCIHRNGLRPGQYLRPFAIRRAFRILPVFWLACIIGIVLFIASSQIEPHNAAALTGTRNLSVSCLVAKMTTVAAILPIAHPCDFLGNAPLLTVMVEIGLYAFYGFVFVKGGERLVLAACGTSLVVGLIAAGLNLKFSLVYNWWQNSSLLSFLPYWWIGAAAVCPSVRQLIVRYVPCVAAAWLVLTLMTHYVDPTAMSAELRKTCLALLMAWLIVKVDQAAHWDNPLSFVGRAGYSVYAFHAPLAIWLCLHGTAWWLTAALAVVLGTSVYYLYERPLDRLGRTLASAKSLFSRAMILETERHRRDAYQTPEIAG